MTQLTTSKGLFLHDDEPVLFFIFFGHHLRTIFRVIFDAADGWPLLRKFPIAKFTDSKVTRMIIIGVDS